MAATRTLSPAWPMGSRLTDKGRLELAGLDAVELSREIGTPAYVLVEDDLRARARAYRTALGDRGEVLFASKALPVTAVYRVMAEEGLSCDVATGGELHLALAGGFDPERIHLHGNAKSEAELRYALESGVGTIILDGFDDIARLDALADRAQRVLLRVTPEVSGHTHAKISTGQRETKFGFALADAPEAIDRVDAARNLELAGLHAHIGSQILDLDPFRRAAEVLAGLNADLPMINVGGGLGVAYTTEEPPGIEEWVEAVARPVRETLGDGPRILVEPGRSLVANAGVTLYEVQTVKEGELRWVAVDGGMSDNLRPMLYGSRYEAQVADRFGHGTPCRIVGKHCESGDVLVDRVSLADPRPGDVIAVAGTGAYGHAMANNYNSVPRPPVVMVARGRARTAVRRETYDDLLARDVP
jgi:diaminopimelate decarboxylase